MLNNQYNQNTQKNARLEFIKILQQNDLSGIVVQANEMHQHLKQIDREMQTLVYENYTKFMSAADLTKQINDSFSSQSITDDLQSLKSALKGINSSHGEIDDRLRLKLKQIKKLDMLRKDLDKLKNLNEMPELLAGSIEKYNAAKKNGGEQDKPQNSNQSDVSHSQTPSSQSLQKIVQIDIKEIFGQILFLYQDYSEILVTYKKTKFMQELYNDIKQYVKKVKLILVNELENIRDQDPLLKEIINSEKSVKSYYVEKKICEYQQKKLNDVISLLVLILQTQYPNIHQLKANEEASQPETNVNHIRQSIPWISERQNQFVHNGELALMIQMLNQYKQSYQQIKFKWLKTLMSNVQSYKQNYSKIQDQSLDLINVKVEDMNAGASALWFIKLVEKDILKDFIQPTIVEYFTIFYHAYGFNLQNQNLSSYELQQFIVEDRRQSIQFSEWHHFNNFIIKLIEPVITLILYYLKDKDISFQIDVQNSLIILKNIFDSLSNCINDLNIVQEQNQNYQNQWNFQNQINLLYSVPKFNQLFRRSIVKKVLHYHFHQMEISIFEQFTKQVDIQQQVSQQMSEIKGQSSIQQNNRALSLQKQFAKILIEYFSKVKEKQDFQSLISKSFNRQQQSFDDFWNYQLDKHFKILFFNCIQNFKDFLISKCTILMNQSDDVNCQNGFILIYISKFFQFSDFDMLFKSVKQSFKNQKQLENDENYQEYIMVTLGGLKEQFMSLSINYRKYYIDFCHQFINQILIEYFQDIKKKDRKIKQDIEAGSSDSVDPANVSRSIFKISNFLFKETLIHLCGKEIIQVYQKLGQNIENITGLIERAPRPELLQKQKNFSQIEMEMDKFLAKKSQIFNKQIFQVDPPSQGSLGQVEPLQFHIYKSIIHLTLKSLYEQMRCAKIMTSSTQNQIHLDIFYLYSSCILIPFYIFSVLLKQKSKMGVNEFEFNSNIEHKEDLNNLKGLINEVMSAVSARTCINAVAIKNDNQDILTSQENQIIDDSLYFTICEANLQKLFA